MDPDVSLRSSVAWPPPRRFIEEETELIREVINDETTPFRSSIEKNIQRWYLDSKKRSGQM